MPNLILKISPNKKIDKENFSMSKIFSEVNCRPQQHEIITANDGTEYIVHSATWLSTLNNRPVEAPTLQYMLIEIKNSDKQKKTI